MGTEGLPEAPSTGFSSDPTRTPPSALRGQYVEVRGPGSPYSSVSNIQGRIAIDPESSDWTDSTARNGSGVWTASASKNATKNPPLFGIPSFVLNHQCYHICLLAAAIAGWWASFILVAGVISRPSSPALNLLSQPATSSTITKKMLYSGGALAPASAPALALAGEGVPAPAPPVSVVFICNASAEKAENWEQNATAAAEAGGPRHLWLHQEVHVYGDACGYTEAALKSLLPQPHGWKARQMRYLYDSRWLQYGPMITTLYKLHVPRGETRCVLMAIGGQVPCVDKFCLVPLKLRPESSDLKVLGQLMELDQFSFIHGYNFSTMLDAGANVGLASLIFGIQFPQARILAVELNPDNFKGLQQNTAFLGNVIAVNAGLYNAVTTMTFKRGTPDNFRGGWDYILVESNRSEELHGSVPISTATISTLQETYGFKSFDFIKIDIEGSEKEVFETMPGGYSPHPWINNSLMICLETHDRIKAGTSKVIGEAFKMHPSFKYARMGEYYAWYNSEKIPQPQKRT